MAYKTMLRQLISKWGVMSIDLQSAIDSDMAVIREDGTKDYVENEQDIVQDQAFQETVPDENIEKEKSVDQRGAVDPAAAFFN